MACFPKLKMAIGMVCCLVFLISAFPLQAQTSSTTNSPAHFFTHGKTWAQESPVEKVQLICALLLLPVFFVAEIMFVVAGFKTSVGWGLFMLFIGGLRSIFAALVMVGWMIQWALLTHQNKPFQIPELIISVFVISAGTGAIVFIISHWEQARKPLAMMGLGVSLILTILGLNFVK